MTKSFAQPLRAGRRWIFADGRTLPVVTGGDGDEPVDNALTLPEDLGAQTAAQLRELHVAFTARIAELRAQDSMTIADTRELRQLIGDANTLAQSINEATEVAPELSDVTPEPEPIDPVVDPAADPVVDPAEGGEPATSTDDAEAETTVDPAAIAASISAGALHVNGGTGTTASETAPAQLPAPFVASVGQHEFQAGAPLEFSEIGEMFVEARRAAKEATRDGKVVLMGVNRYAADKPMLSGTNGAIANTRLINELPQAPRSAAICGPLDIVRAIPNCVSMGRPVRDRFRQVPADRGAFQYIQSVGLGDVADAVSLWTDTDQSNVDPGDPSTWKGCHSLVCKSPTEVEVQAIPSCMLADKKQEFSSPEQVENNIATIAALTERTAEANLLATVDSLASAYTFTGNYGFGPALVEALSTELSAALDTFREIDPSGYTAFVPQGLAQQLVVDEVSRGHFELDLDAPDQQLWDAVLGKYMRYLGIDYEIVRDAATGHATPWSIFAFNPPGAAAVALPTPPASWQVRLVDTSAGFFADTGQINFGIMHSPELARQNLTQWFGEIFELLGKQGCQPWFTTRLTLCANGDRAGFSEPVVCPPS